MRYTIKTKLGDVVVNDGILRMEEYQAIKLHRDRKNSLGGRLIILREYIKQSLSSGEQWVNDSDHLDKLEDLLDCALKDNNYNIEKAIDHYRKASQKEDQEASTTCRCGYRKPFCLC